jgi:putative hydrolase of the HAD superfamily
VTSSRPQSRTTQPTSGVPPAGGSRAIWTDFGGVLTPPITHTFMTFCRSQRLEPEPVMRAVMTVTASYGTADVMLPLDTPLVTEQEWLRQVAAALRDDEGVVAHLDSLADAWFDGRETNHEWLEALRQFRSLGFFVGLLSNMVPSWDTHWRRMVPPGPAFDDVVLSFEVGVRKPDREIFDLCARRADVAPEGCVLVDDSGDNCAGARAAGWRAIRFTDSATASAELASLLGAGPAAAPQADQRTAQQV